jgi:hypothetical protein
MAPSRQNARRTAPASAADAYAVAEVWLRSRRAAIPDVPAPPHSDDEVRRLFETVLVPTRETWLPEAGGWVIAVLVLDGDELDTSTSIRTGMAMAWAPDSSRSPNTDARAVLRCGPTRPTSRRGASTRSGHRMCAMPGVATPRVPVADLS